MSKIQCFFDDGFHGEMHRLGLRKNLLRSSWFDGGSIGVPGHLGLGKNIRQVSEGKSDLDLGKDF